ncbi:MAG: chloride channel protein [Niabella sp.]
MTGLKRRFFKLISTARLRAKKILDRLLTNRLKHGVLTAVPFWVGSFVIGVLAFFYAWIFHKAELLMFEIMDYKAWLIFLLAPAGFIISWWLVTKFAPYSKGSGIPQVMAAIEIDSPATERKVSKLLSLRIIVVKFFSSIVLVLGGGAIGREGPTIQISGSVFNFINQIIPKWWPKVSRKNMILTGAAAGLSAAFNTPLGGIVFAVEELTKIHFNYFKTAIFTAVIIAGLTAQQLAGPYLYLGYPKIGSVSGKIFLSVILVAAIAGLSAAIMSKLILAILNFKKKFTKPSHHLLFLAASALIVATFAFFIHESILGSGKGLIEQYLFTKNNHASELIPFSRVLGTSLAFTSGGAGGIFAPALSCGASIGSAISGWFNFSQTETNVLILAGMVAFLTGVTRSPFTSAIIVLEMTDRHSIILDLMTAALVAGFVSLLISKRSLYDRLKTIYMRELSH